MYGFIGPGEHLYRANLRLLQSVVAAKGNLSHLFFVVEGTVVVIGLL